MRNELSRRQPRAFIPDWVLIYRRGFLGLRMLFGLLLLLGLLLFVLVVLLVFLLFEILLAFVEEALVREGQLRFVPFGGLLHADIVLVRAGGAVVFGEGLFVAALPVPAVA